MTPKQARFVAEYAIDGNGTAAAIRAGYARRSAHVRAARLIKDKQVAEAIHDGQAETCRMLKLDRERVLAGLLDAVETARAQADPHALIRAWSEIGRMCGFYAPEKRVVDVSVASQRRLGELETMSDEELLVLAETSLTKPA